VAIDRWMGLTPNRRLIEGMDCFLEDRAEQLEKAGKDSSGFVRRFREVDQSLFHRSCLRTGTQQHRPDDSSNVSGGRQQYRTAW